MARLPGGGARRRIRACAACEALRRSLVRMATSRPPAATFAESLRSHGPARVLALLEARPDLAVPSPSTLRSLGARATSRTSLERAVAHLDACRLTVLEAVLALDDATRPGGVPADVVVRAVLGPDADADDVAAVRDALADVRTAGLVWEPLPDDPAAAPTQDVAPVRPAPGLDELLGAHPAGLGPSDDAARAAVARAGDDTDVLTRDAPPGAREVLAALTWGPPVGVAPRTDPRARAAVDWLVEQHLLLAVDGRHVVLPREVALALRGGRTHRGAAVRPPRPAGAQVRDETVEAEAASAALEAVRLVAHLLAVWQEQPPPVLRTGGLGVRELRRLAQTLGVDDPTAASVAELALVAGLVSDDGDDPPSFAPTTAADDWLDLEVPRRWAALATSWGATPRTPWVVGSRDERGTLRAALDPELHRAWVPALRASVLGVLAAQPGVSLDAHAVLEVLRWRSPRAVPPEHAVEGLLADAALLGVTGAGALSPVGRALLEGLDRPPTPGRVDALGDALETLVPPPVDELLLQGDLTGIVPGRPSTTLESLLAGSADVESRGAAVTVRFTADSVTRALDAGRTADELLDDLGAHARGGVPQPLEYLVRDAARRHGRLRVGAATSYLRAEDPALVVGLVEDPALRGLGLFRIAPTVLAAHVPAIELRAALRARGLSPTVEGPDGQVLHAEGTAVRIAGRRRPAWLGGPPARRPRSLRPDPRAESIEAPAPEPADARHARLSELAALLVATAGPAPSAAPSPRSSPASSLGSSPGSSTAASTASDAARPDAGANGTTATPAIPATPGTPGTPGGADQADAPASDTPRGEGTSEPADALALLRETIELGGHVWLEVVGPRGLPDTRRVRPLRLDAGRLRAVDADREAELTVAVHRIASVRPA
ncbi:hypothetical protein Slu03_00280 [Sediminihabitans luteus]|nr:hypothetical protein Slu03_00280 [Sediminihabitans luteus]